MQNGFWKITKKEVTVNKQGGYLKLCRIRTRRNKGKGKQRSVPKKPQISQ
jgi:hypothetical protein